MVMTVEKLISLLQKVVTQEATVIMRVNDRGQVLNYPVDGVILLQNLETDDLCVILERGNTAR
jgi:hypothetical protein